MDRNYSISVAMATYNGEKYIKEQIDSILNQLSENDELVISDDGSTDKTISIIESYHDSRIKLINNPYKGVKKNFENAIKNCNKTYIFLSDQDDVWLSEKKSIILNSFKTYNADLIIHDCYIVNENLQVTNESFYKIRNSKKGFIKNLYKNSYIGCCMAFKKTMTSKIIPIPDDIEMHDQWIGLITEKYGKVKFINDKLIYYRRHEDNATQMHHHSFFKMVKNRIIFIKNYFK